MGNPIEIRRPKLCCGQRLLIGSFIMHRVLCEHASMSMGHHTLGTWQWPISNLVTTFQQLIKHYHGPLTRQSKSTGICCCPFFWWTHMVNSYDSKSRTSTGCKRHNSNLAQKRICRAIIHFDETLPSHPVAKFRDQSVSSSGCNNVCRQQPQADHVDDLMSSRQLVGSLDAKAHESMVLLYLAPMLLGTLSTSDQSMNQRVDPGASTR